jgi:hypothetical protein
MYRTYSMLLKTIYFFTRYKSSVCTCFAKQIMPILHILFYNGSLVTWTIISLNIAKSKPLICLCLASPYSIPRICSVSRFGGTSACRLRNFITYSYTYWRLKASITSMCSLHVILLLKITPKYFTWLMKGIFRPFNVRWVSGDSTDHVIYIASARTIQKTPLPTVPPLLHGHIT